MYKNWLLRDLSRDFPAELLRGIIQRVHRHVQSDIRSLTLKPHKVAGNLSCEHPELRVAGDFHFAPSFFSATPRSTRSTSPTTLHFFTRNLPSVPCGIAAMSLRVNSQSMIRCPSRQLQAANVKSHRLIQAAHWTASSVEASAISSFIPTE